MVINDKCWICGSNKGFQYEDHMVLLREAKCCECGASIRNSDVAHAIVQRYAPEGDSLQSSLDSLQEMRILNLAASGCIHNTLKKLNYYTESEFFDDIKSGMYNNGVLCVDLCQMPFCDNCFDLVISEDVLEHVGDVEKAFREIDRVLKRQGVHVFTVPIHENEETKSRLGNPNKVYHGDPIREEGTMVCTDFGNDIEEFIKKIAGESRRWSFHCFYKPTEITNVDITYDEYLSKRNVLDRYFKYNSIVIETEKRNMDVKFTGERFIPGIENEELETEHIQRYMSALSVVKGKIIVDIACGEGYGTNILASEALYVTGIDISGDTIKRASKKYIRDNINFLVGDVANIPLESGSVDVVISFETIEHVSEEKQKLFLKEIKRILKKNGVLIMSTPNKEIYSDKYNYHNEFHIKEFYKNEFIEFIKSEFINLQLYNQYDEVANVIESVPLNKKAGLFKSGQREGKYYIIVASDDTLPCMSQVVSVRGGEEYSRCIDYIIKLQNEEEKRNKHICELDDEIEEKNLYIVKLQESEKEHNNYVKVLQEDNQAKEEVIETLKQELKNKQGHIELLLESERELERLKAQLDRRMIRRIFPVGSKRRLLVKLAVKAIRHPIKTIRLVFTKGRLKNFLRVLKQEDALVVSKAVDDHYRGNGLKKQELLITKLVQRENILEYEPIVFQKQERPKVSIIIPVYNQFEYTYNCLKAILNNSGDISYEVIIANDCSTDFTTEIEKIVKNICVITNQTNLRFLKNCNNAAKYAKGEYILFLNNDTQVQPAWLEALVELIGRDENIGMVGSKLVYADGRLQEAGGILWKDGTAWNYGNRRNPEEPEFNYVKEVDYISGAAIMIRAALWNEIGGFDERFAPAYCEDSDLAFEVRKHGYKVMYQPLSVVVHFEGISNGTELTSGQKAYQVVNQKKFLEKWKNVLECEHFPNAENVFVARDRTKDKPTILMVDHYVPQFDKDAGSRTVYQYLKLFVDKGFNVKFIGDNFYQHEPYTTVLQQMGIEVLYGPYYAKNWKEWVLENAADFDYVFLNRPHISVKYIDFLRKNTKAKIVYYGHDLHFLREQRRYELENDPDILKESVKLKAKEIALMKQADIVYYPSSVEIEEIAKIDQRINAKAIIAYLFEAIESDEYCFNMRKDIMFVGGFSHKPNIDAVVWFTNKIFPRVLADLPDVRLYIIGSNPTQKVLELANDNVIVKGFVTDDELEGFYRKCRMSIVPLRYGAGIKGKVIEAMRYGIPVVTTSVGAEGITGAEDILCVEDDELGIGRKIVALYSDQNKLKEMSHRSYEYIKANFSMENAWKIIEKDFS